MLNFIKKWREKKKQAKKETPMELLRSLVIAVLLAMIFRSFAFEPFHIPSGSMKPTLLVGDYIFVSKYDYGYSRYSLPFGMNLIEDRIFYDEPKRGDIVVFKLPSDTSINYIKRIVGMPGDRIQVVKGVLYINDKPVQRKRIKDFTEHYASGSVAVIPQYVETLPEGVQYRVLDQQRSGPLDNTKVYNVPEKHYFLMGDNRDNSQDSRVLGAVGFVPEKNILGPAKMVFFSSTASLLEVWKWFSGFRYDRFFESIEYD